MESVNVDGATLTVRDVVAVARGNARVTLDEGARTRIAASREVVDALIRDARPSHGITHREKVGRVRVKVDTLEEHEEGAYAYGITTGFGELARVPIHLDDTKALQLNLLLSHACGLGDPLPREVVRGMMLLRANALAVGFSGARVEVVTLILELLNHGITPVVPHQGSLGASGDLVPLAHAALVLVGLGEAEVDGRVVSGADALAQAGLEPVVLEAKEGLALINGTQLMASTLALAVHDGWRLVRTAEGIGSLSVDVLMGSDKPFDARIHAARPHAGQGASAANLRRFLDGSGIVASHIGCDRVQDAYSLRCMPQVLGAARTALAHAEEVAGIELNSATDNPLIFPEGDTISGGNFHGEPLALVAGYLTTAMAEIASISERRVARLIDPRLSEGLPPFLTAHSGLHSGYMLPQYVAAGLVMENRVLCHPAGVDSIPTSANQEDHVSNGAVAVLNLSKVLRNAEKAVGIEALLAAQALEFRRPLRAGPGGEAVHGVVRARVPKLETDRYLKPEMDAAIDAVRSGAILHALEAAVGGLD